MGACIRGVGTSGRISGMSVTNRDVNKTILTSCLKLCNYSSISGVAVLGSTFAKLSVINYLFGNRVTINVSGLVPFVGRDVGSSALNGILSALGLLRLTIPGLRKFLRARLPSNDNEACGSHVCARYLISNFNCAPDL